MKPLCIDVFCGLGGWTEGFLAEGWECIGFDIERHDYGSGGYPAQLVLQDALTIHGKQFRQADCLVMSPPCQEYSYMAMPWSRAKQIEREYMDGTRNTAKLTELFDACFRIQREACEASGRHIPLIVENVRGAQKWVGRAHWNHGSFYLWGDVPALMPMTVKARKNSGGSWFSVERDGRPGARNDPRDGIKQRGSGREWFAGEGKISRVTSSNSPARKRASAMIAKIPLPLSRHIALVFHPRMQEGKRA